jgi:hypothetical protein
MASMCPLCRYHGGAHARWCTPRVRAERASAFPAPATPVPAPAADTSAARAAIRAAMASHAEIMGGLSTALLKMEAAGGLIPAAELPWPADSPTWTDHALNGLDQAGEAIGKLTAALRAAAAEVAQVNRPAPATGGQEALSA